MIHACGHTMYRTMDGEHHCPRCETRDDTCPACNGDGYRLKGRMMSTCAICRGTGKTNARISGHLNEALMVNSNCGVCVQGQDYDDLVAEQLWTGQRQGTNSMPVERR